MSLRAYLPLGFLVAVSCTPPHTTITRLSKISVPSKETNCDIEVLTQAPITRKYFEIAILNTVIVGAQQKDLNAMLPDIKAKACELGADAIVIKNVESAPPNKQDAPGKAYTVVIKYID